MSSPIFTPIHLVDLGFLEARSKLLDLAAFLDRVERAGVADDYRVQALIHAFQELSRSQPDRTRRILELLSDSSIIPLDHASTKSAAGAPLPAQS